MKDGLGYYDFDFMFHLKVKVDVNLFWCKSIFTF